MALSVLSKFPNQMKMNFLQSTRMTFFYRRPCSTVARLKLQNRIRNNNEECSNQMEKSGKFIIFHNGKPLVKRGTSGSRMEPILASFSQVLDFNPILKDTSVFLRVHPDFGPLFAAQISDEKKVSEIEDAQGANFLDMRAAMFMVDEKQWAGFLCQAHSLLRWNQKTSFCSSCGSRLRRNAAGVHRECQDCKSVFYPQTSPVAIILLTSLDHSKVLLIRQPQYPPGMFSCVAGFVDAGETLQECVQREAAEEVSVDIVQDRGIQYLNSQFWPFPTGSLMIACMAYVPDNAVPQPCLEEVEATRWFTPNEIADALERVRKNPTLRLAKENNPGNIFVPPRGAIANYMLKMWLQNYAKK